MQKNEHSRVQQSNERWIGGKKKQSMMRKELFGTTTVGDRMEVKKQNQCCSIGSGGVGQGHDLVGPRGVHASGTAALGRTGKGTRP
jgi:hypothetical protein